MILTYRNKTVLNISKLNTELCNSLPAIHSVVLLGTNQLRICSTAELSAEDVTLLDTLLAEFTDSDPAFETPRILKYAKQEARNKHIHNILYTGPKELSISLIPKRTISHGEVVKVEWFASRDAEGLHELILDVDISYTRDASGFAVERTTTRTWYTEGGQPIGDKKITKKYYDINPCDMVTEGTRRRKLLVDNIQIPINMLMMEVLLPQGFTQEAVLLKGREFMDSYTGEIDRFVANTSTITDPANVNYGKKSICVAFASDILLEHNWLDMAPPSIGGQTTIRQYLINEFDI